MKTIEDQFVGEARALLPVLVDETVTDVLINGCRSCFIERHGKLHAVQNPFTTQESLADLIQRMLLPSGKLLDARRPFVDGSLVDGSRFHIVSPPMAPQGPMVSIRKWPKSSSFKLKDFGDTAQMFAVGEAMREAKNILIAGSTGSGKTSLLNCLLETFSENQRVLILEETPEIRVSSPHWVRLLGHSTPLPGHPEYGLDILLRNALRMRPDRLILGECRGGEATVFVQAMNTGHSGCLGTVHARSALEALSRLEALVLQGMPTLPLNVCRQWISASIDWVVFLNRNRKCSDLVSIHGLEGDHYRHTPFHASSIPPLACAGEL